MDRPVVMVGYFGWSNVRSGLEFYVEGEEDARRSPRRRPGVVNRSWSHDGMEYGLLLQDEFERAGVTEGTNLIVLALPGRLTLHGNELLQRVLSEAIANVGRLLLEND